MLVYIWLAVLTVIAISHSMKILENRDNIVHYTNLQRILHKRITLMSATLRTVIHNDGQTSKTTDGKTVQMRQADGGEEEYSQDL